MTDSNTPTLVFQKSLIPFEQVGQLSQRDVWYQTGNEKLRPFYKYQPSLESFEQVIKDKSKDNFDRDLLVEVLKKQYTPLKACQNCFDSIERLRDKNTFTIVTAHQPSLLTGPLYFIYKICSAINLTETLKVKFPQYNFVPLFVSGGEDHDFDEVKSTSIFGKQLVWESGESGSVGKMKTKTLAPILAQLKDILGDSQNATEIYNVFATSFENFDTYGQAVQNYVKTLFKKYGLIAIDMSDPALKGSFKSIIREEIFNNTSHELVTNTIDDLEKVGIKKQAHPREINFFYMDTGIRNRIVKTDTGFEVLDTDLKFSPEEMEKEIDQHPEKFSPNVVMRPIYQEFILPNLAYVGGGGELAYWMERKTQFEHFKINFPVLIRRNSVLWINGSQSSKRSKLDLSVDNLFQKDNELTNFFINQNTEHEIDLASEKEELELLFKKLKQKVEQIDKSLASSVEATKVSQLKDLNKLEQRIKKSEKSKHEVGLRQVLKLQDKLFPKGSLQERKDNFIPFYLSHGRRYLDFLVENLDPLVKEFVVVEEVVG